MACSLARPPALRDADYRLPPVIVLPLLMAIFDSDSRKIIILYVMAYTSPEGKTYKDYHEYCNSDDLETMEIAMKLYAGSRTTQNDEERKMLKEMKGASERGEILDFPMTPF